MSDQTGTSVEVIPLGNGRYQVVNGSRRLIAFAVASRDVWVFLDGHVYTITDRADGAARRSRIDDQAALTAPMPATPVCANRPGQGA